MMGISNTRSTYWKCRTAYDSVQARPPPVRTLQWVGRTICPGQRGLVIPLGNILVVPGLCNRPVSGTWLEFHAPGTTIQSPDLTR